MQRFYQWQNELRDQETKIKANYSAAVSEFLKKQYDSQLAALDAQLSQADETLREHTNSLAKLHALLLKVSDEITDLSLAAG